MIHARKKIAQMAKEGGRMPQYLAEVRAILESLTPVRESIAASVVAKLVSLPQPAQNLSQPSQANSPPLREAHGGGDARGWPPGRRRERG